MGVHKQLRLEVPIASTFKEKMSSSAFQVSVFTGPEFSINGDKNQNFIGRNCVTYLAVALFYLSCTMKLTYIS